MLDIDGFLTSPEFVTQIAIIIAGILSVLVNGLLEGIFFGGV